MRAVLMEKGALRYCVLSLVEGVFEDSRVSCYKDEQCHSGTEVEQKEEETMVPGDCSLEVY